MTDSQTIFDHLKSLKPPDRMKKILDITDLKERNRQTALWACEFGFDELRPMPLPTEPEKIRQYRGLPADTRKKMNENAEKYHAFWNDTVVTSYLTSSNMVIHKNKENFEWIKTLKIWLKPDDFKELTLITNRIYDFTSKPKQDWNEVEG